MGDQIAIKLILVKCMMWFQAEILAPRSHDEYSWVFLTENDTNENESIYLDWTLRYKDFSFRQERFEWKHLRHKNSKNSRFSEEIQRYWIQMEEILMVEFLVEIH